MVKLAHIQFAVQVDSYFIIEDKNSIFILSRIRNNLKDVLKRQERAARQSIEERNCWRVLSSTHRMKQKGYCGCALSGYSSNWNSFLSKLTAKTALDEVLWTEAVIFGS